MRVISFRHEQHAGNAAAIAGFLTKKPGICLTVSAPGFLNGLTALANATTNCFPMILISGSSEREIVDLQQGDYEEMDQLAIAKPLCKAAFRVLHAADIGIGVARAIRAAVSGRPGGVYLDLPAKLFSQVIDAEAGAESLVKVIDPAPAQLPAPAAVTRALDLLKSAKRPLIILGKGAAYAQADDQIRALVEKSGIPFLPMSMAKGLLPDTHPQCAGAARSTVLKDSDVVMLIGARLNWLLSHGKGKTWGEPRSKKFIQIDIEPKEMDSNVEIVAPVVGDIGSCVSALLDGMGGNWPAPPADWINAVKTQTRGEHRQDGAAADEQPVADGLPRRARRTAHRHQGAAGRHPRQRRRQHARSGARRRSTCISRANASTSAPGASWASAWASPSPPPSRPASPCSRSKATAPSASPAWRSRPSAATTCRSASSSSTTTASIAEPTSMPRASDPAITVFVKGARYDKMIEAFGGVGVNATTPDELKRAVDAAMDSGKPTLINAVIDPAAGTESGSIGKLNPQSAVRKK